MIAAVFILALFALALWFVWDDLSELIAEELDKIGVGESTGDAQGVRDSGGLTATLTCSSVAGADTPYDWDTAA